MKYHNWDHKGFWGCEGKDFRGSGEQAHSFGDIRSSAKK